MSNISRADVPTGAVQPPSVRAALAFWFELGCVSFGGPAGQIALMHTELVERRRWIGEQRFRHALSYCMLLPGPEAQQLATYLGWLLHGPWGGVAAGGLFVLPSLLLMIGLAWGYLAFGHWPPLAGMFAAIKPAVVALVLLAAWRLARRNLTGLLPWLVALLALLAVSMLQLPFPWVIGVAAGIGLLAQHRPFSAPPGARPKGGRGFAGGLHAAPPEPVPSAVIDDARVLPDHARPTAARLRRALALGLAVWALAFAAVWSWPGAPEALRTMAVFFTQAALVSFGGAYAVLPYVMQAAVERYGWLSAAQMLDGLALGESTPGPLIMVVAFVGFLGGWQQQWLGPSQLATAGMLAACVATLFTFLPSFLFILIGAPWVEATRGQPRWAAALACVGAAVVGVIGDFAFTLGQAVLWPASGPDAPALVIVLSSLVLLGSNRCRPIPLLLACALLGAAAAWVDLPLSSRP